MHDTRGDGVGGECSTFRESGTCPKGRSCRLDQIQRAVIDGLKTPDLVAAFIEAAQKDRRTAAKTRATAARDRDRATAAIERLQKALIAGRVEEDFFDREIIPLRQDLAAAQERRAAALEAQIISLHPAALAQMRRTLEILRIHLPLLDPDEEKAMFDALRSLIDHIAIIEHDDRRIEAGVIGTFSALCGADSGDGCGG
ncbi:hypothetical protein [Rhodobacter capsulatus]|uniref:hypothetical protein n=1 Tax=Rhodobacter capsulatus TaxID=1061 RepID=UPI0003D2CB84|nr:hypothetical protein [Rhodobacter capsulatus]ETD86618.1 hypothetical protein U716_02720 [Rhodobacter capsulatus B6]